MEKKLIFLGGIASEITGSCYHLTITEGDKSTQILVDIGLIQGSFKESLEINRAILKQINPSEINFIILTHSHMDHIGRLPLLVKHGFKGQVLCTASTSKILKPMLEDSAKIQLAEAAYLLKTMGKKIEPLYLSMDVEKVQPLLKIVCRHGQWLKLGKNIHVKFYNSGHVMGGAIIVLRTKDGNENSFFCFTGDLGRRDGIILPPPETVKEKVDYLIVESTYGGKVNPGREEEITKLLELIRISHQKSKRVIIPSFALERTQEIIYLLSYHMQNGNIPKVPMYLDAPLGTKITKIFAEAWGRGMFSDQAMLDFNPFDEDQNPFLNIINESYESDALIAKKGNYIVIAGSGMCDSGRVRGHLRAHLREEDTMVFLVGYMAKNSLGRLLKESRKVRMNKEEIFVRAEIVAFDSFSAHADGQFLLDYVQEMFQREEDKQRRIFIVHGELESARALQTELRLALKEKKVKVVIPELNEKVEL